MFPLAVISWSWTRSTDQEELRTTGLSTFPNYWIVDPDVLQQKSWHSSAASLGCLDLPPPTDEIRKVILHRNSNKATGQDSVPAEIYKALKLFTDIPVHLGRYLAHRRDAWRFCDAFIVACYKTKRSKSDCGKYRVSHCCPSQARFLPASSLQTVTSWKGTSQGHSDGLEQSTADMIFTMKQIHQKCIE